MDAVSPHSQLAVVARSQLLECSRIGVHRQRARIALPGACSSSPCGVYVPCAGAVRTSLTEAHQKWQRETKTQLAKLEVDLRSHFKSTVSELK